MSSSTLRREPETPAPFIGAGSIGLAIARRVSAGKHVLLADLRQDNADVAAKVLRDAGFEVSTALVFEEFGKIIRLRNRGGVAKRKRW